MHRMKVNESYTFFKLISAIVLVVGIWGCSSTVIPGGVNDTGKKGDVLDTYNQDSNVDVNRDVVKRDAQKETSGDIGIDLNQDVQQPDRMVGDSSEIEEILHGNDALEVVDVFDNGQLHCPGEAGCPCKDNSDCYQGFCIEGKNGKECAALCNTDNSCPDGYTCSQVVNTGGDTVFICVYKFANICRPCEKDEECANPYTKTINRCVPYGMQGSFCGVNCNKDEDCPDGYICKRIDFSDGTSVNQCIIASGQCPCTDEYKKNGYKTKCYIENEFGKCWGERTCNSKCSARTPKQEECNLVDDDCNGKTDDNVPEKECDITNEFGTCKGHTICASGKVECIGQEPKKEVCNGIDDNCDGYTDEGFKDTDGDGIADCVDDDIDGDGINNDEDNCPDVANPDQKDTDSDGKGDACDNANDRDNDGIVDDKDNCPDVANPDQKDTDKDGRGDACDDDVDGDGINNDEDNCPDVANPDQNDMDKDGKGDACDNDLDGDGDPNETDCAPQDPEVFHNAIEKCDGKDDNCNGVKDEENAQGCKTYYLDADGDGYGVTDNHKCLCTPDGKLSTLKNGDCNDNDPAINPGVQERCDGKHIDDNCNGTWNEENAQGCVKYYVDKDNDGYAANNGKCLCDVEGNYKIKVDNPATYKWDCNEDDPAINPGKVEVCDNNKDDNCNGKTDEEGAFGCKEYYYDEDNDGYGTDNKSGCFCSGHVPANYVSKKGDCAPQNPAVYPGATERCNGVDDNCNGQTDEGFTDTDGDRIADCVDKDDDNDGVPDISDCQPLNPNVPNCKGKQCGDDGCGGSCGSCTYPDTCIGGRCVCQPNCAGKQCGPDGCGGSCGSCTYPDTCENGRCVCHPNCAGKQCGPDGCGGSCGSCTYPDTCENGRCVCHPNCAGKECGSDGCGGSCGSCSYPETCQSGRCVCNCRSGAFCKPGVSYCLPKAVIVGNTGSGGGGLLCPSGYTLIGKWRSGPFKSDGWEEIIDYQGRTYDRGFAGLCLHNPSDAKVVVLYDDCSGQGGSCPAGYSITTKWHIGWNTCSSSVPLGYASDGRTIKSGWLGLCVRPGVGFEAVAYENDCNNFQTYGCKHGWKLRGSWHSDPGICDDLPEIVDGSTVVSSGWTAVCVDM